MTKAYRFEFDGLCLLLFNNCMEKQCFKCRETKPLSEFYPHSRMADGHLNKCKTCNKRDSTERIERVKHDPAWLNKERERSRNKSALARKLGKASPTTQESRKRWIEKNRHKVKAHVLSSNAVRDGKLKRKTSCEKCGATGDIEKHHPDYSKPLLVEWLCTKCHGKTRHKDAYAEMAP